MVTIPKNGDFVKILLVFSILSDLFFPIHLNSEVVGSGGFSVIDLSKCICNLLLSLFVWGFVIVVIVVPNVVPMLNLAINNKKYMVKSGNFTSKTKGLL